MVYSSEHLISMNDSEFYMVWSTYHSGFGCVANSPPHIILGLLLFFLLSVLNTKWSPTEALGI